MNALLKKLNFKAQKSILVINAPEEFKETMQDFTLDLKVLNNVSDEEIEFVLIFATKLEEVQKLAKEVSVKMKENGLFWFAYPKGSSKKYKCDFNRDNGWQAMVELGYEPVRMVAIDEDWSALRFRKPENIKQMTRNPEWIMTEAGKKKANK